VPITTGMTQTPRGTAQLRNEILEMLRYARPGSEAARALWAQLERLDASPSQRNI
jgi:hypothetical protein